MSDMLDKMRLNAHKNKKEPAIFEASMHEGQI